MAPTLLAYYATQLKKKTAIDIYEMDAHTHKHKLGYDSQTHTQPKM